MKKLIAISITLALVASAAFAQLTISGQAKSKWVAFQSNDGDDALTNLAWWGRMKLDAANGDGTFGGSVRILEGTTMNVPDWAWVWWKPIQQVEFRLGKMSDGWYGADDLTDWGFHADANDFVVSNDFYSGAAFAHGGLFNSGASFVITPLDGLKVVFGLPYELNAFGKYDGSADVNAMGVWKHFLLQAQYSLDNIGIITLTYKSGTQDWRYNSAVSDKNNPLSGYVDDGTGTYVPASNYADVSKIYASFQLKMIENLGLHFGIGYALPAQFKETTGKDAKINSPLAIGLGAEYKAGDFGVRGRLEFTFLGSYDDGQSSNNVTPTPFNFNLELLPYYDLGILKAYLALGMKLVTDTENAGGTNVGEAHADFLVNPYIEKAVGAGTFFAGFQLIGLADKDSVSSSGVQKYKEKWNWAIPVGLLFNF